uniref:Uncharacterized protein n=1 Tax=Arion vulgaris TaxID=1028688 RepID=A0A0B7AUK9_9EUPU
MSTKSVFVVKSSYLITENIGKDCINCITNIHFIRCVAPNDSANAGMVMALFLVFGVLCGINFSRVWGIVIGSG